MTRSRSAISRRRSGFEWRPIRDLYGWLLSTTGSRAKRSDSQPGCFSTVVAMNAVAVIREGEGPEVLLVHGGASPETTWGALAPLRARWTLARVYRRGYPPSPTPPEGRQDFEVDAADVASLL